MSRKKVIVGNWKMNQLSQDIFNFFAEFNKEASKIKCNVGIAAQALHLPLIKEHAPKENFFEFGAQNCSQQEKGAFTGEISPAAIKDLGCGFTLVGHSERRTLFKENDQLLNQKTKLALEKGLYVIFCCGETLEEREGGRTMEVVRTQLIEGLKEIPAEKKERLIIAYEPVWAIGTGKTATKEQAQEVHAFIRGLCAKELGFKADELIIQYGGSVTPANVDELLSMPDIDGALVGGASLKPQDFLKLCLAGSK